MAFNEEQQKDKLASIRRKEEEELALLLSKKYKTPYLDLSRTSIDPDALRLVPEDRARAAGLAVIRVTGKNLQVAVKNPTASAIKETVDELHRMGYQPQLFLVSMQSLERAWSRYKELGAETEITSNIIDITRVGMEEFKERVKNTTDFQEFLNTKISLGATEHITNLLDIILAGAYELETSDVHVEPAENKVHLRIRLDGVLQNVTDVSPKAYKMLLARIKLVSELKLNIHDRPQDGRFTIRADGKDVEVRVSTLPGPNGETIVMRILHPKAIALTFEKLGMHSYVQKMVERELQQPNGMIITTGPTGSGKTTTLYAFIKKVNQPEIKIITIEDPIEYHIEGISQTQVDKSAGYTFESGLSAIMRQDPDIILVGEIRNRETAEIALQASLTGHLVFSTLHTNDAPGTIPRLIDLGAPPNIIAPAINIAIAQRLVRVLCQTCKKEVAASPDELAVIKKEIELLPKQYDRPPLENIKVFDAGSCTACNNTGYKGRIGVYEAFLITDAIEKLILRNPTEAEVREVAVSQGMITLKQDGILKVLSGITSIAELQRVVGF